MTRRGFISLAAASALRADTSQERARKILNQTIDALGGDAFRYLKTRTERGRAYSFYRENISGLDIAKIYTKYLDEPVGGLRQVQRQAFGKKEDDAVIVTGKEAWEVNFRGARPLGDERVQQFTRSTLHDVFYVLRMRLDEPEMLIEYRGSDVIENLPVEKVEFNDSENRTLTVWIHASTMLPVKQSFKRWDPLINDRREEVTRYTKYRKVENGIMWPYDTQRERDSEKIFELYSDKVTVGEDMPASLFQLPAGATILTKKK